MKNKFVLIAAVALAGGSIPPFAKLSLEVVEPFTLVFFRFFAASMVIYYFMPKADLSKKNLWELRWIALIGAGNPIFIFLSLEHLPSNITALFYSIVPGLGVAYLWFAKKERPTTIQALGFLAGLSGVALISQQIVGTNDEGNVWLGFGFAAIAVLSFFVYGILSKEKMRNTNISGAALAFYFAVITFVVAAPLALYETIQEPWVDNLELQHILAILYLGFIGTGAQYLLFQKTLKVMEVAYANLFVYLQPVVGVTLAFFLVDEKVTWQLVLGGAVVLIGARLALSKQSSKLS